MRRPVKLFLGLAFCFCACSKGEFTIEAEETKLVVYAFFETDHLMELTVGSTSPPVGEPSVNIVDHASVLLFEDGELLGEMTRVDTGLYNINKMPVPGKTYQFFVEADGFPPVNSTLERMPKIPDIQKIETVDSLGVDFKGLPKRTFSKFNAQFSTPILEAPYFTIDATYADLGNRKLYWTSAVSSCVSEESYSINGIYGTSLACFSTVDSLVLETTNHDNSMETAATEVIKLCQVNQATHEFNVALENNSTSEGSAIIIAPIPLPSNIVGGYGLFSLSNCHTFEFNY